MTRFWSDLTNSAAFSTGLLWGAAALVAGIVAAALWRRSAQPAVAGWLYSAAALVTVTITFEVHWAVPVGAALVAAACGLGDAIWDRALGSAIGAGVLVFGADVASGAGGIVLVAAIAVCAALVVAFDDAYRGSALGMPFLAAATVGVLLTVPDTERAMALSGAALPLILLGWPWRLTSLGAGAGAAAALIGWVGGLAAAARPGAAVGALGSLGLMLAAPLGMRLAATRTPMLAKIASSGPWRAVAVIAVHGVLVFGASRIAGLQDSAALAALILTPFLAVGAVLGGAPAPAPAEVSTEA